MRRLQRGHSTLLAGVVLLWLLAPAATLASPVDPARTVPAADAMPDVLGFRLARAALEQRVGHTRGVIENLERIDFSQEPAHADADRAAFLLGQAYLRMGSRERFLALAGAVAHWSHRTPYTQWIAYQALVLETERSGAPVDQLGLLSQTQAGGSFATSDTIGALGRDLAGAARIEQAQQALARGEDPRAILAGVPASSRYAPRARHVAGLAAIERGDRAWGRQALEALFTDTPDYPARREVALALAGMALEDSRWEDANAWYARIDREWSAQAEPLRRLVVRDSLEALWTAWESDPDPSGVLRLDVAPLRLLGDEWVLAATDLTSRREPTAPSLGTPTPLRTPWRVEPPPIEDWQAVGASARALGEAEQALERARWDEARAREVLGDRRRFLGIGLGHGARERQELAAWSGALDSLRAALEANDARLRAVRDEAARRVAERTTRLIGEARLEMLWMEAMQRWALDGPGHRRETAPPSGYPSADSLLAREQALTSGVATLAGVIARTTPDLLARSYEQAWRPKVIERTNALAASAAAASRWNETLRAALDSSLAAAGSSPELVAAIAGLAARAADADSLRSAHDELRTVVASRAVERQLTALDAEREGIDYGLAASAYARSVRLAAADSVGPRLTANASAPADSAHAAYEEEQDDPETARWRTQAITSLEAFLVHHPDSPARAETRFRLADVLMAESRQSFRSQMAQYVRVQSAGTAAGMSLPILTHAPALELYRQILAEDADFPRRDAVLFNAGMILADEGDPEAGRFFSELVEKHPGSPYGQEAWLRMGDMAFNEKQFPLGVKRYEHAAAGPDAGLRVIALYKLGWAHFNEDRFEAAADAFRQVLDLYGSEHRREIQADIEGEADAYLLHSLAGAGGAEAFARYFDRIGPRPYEKRVLLALGQHFRRYGEFPRATEVDELAISRHGLEPEALVSAQRLIETLTRSERAVDAREARRALAPKFAPGSPWATAQRADSTRADGERFAHQAWRAVAEEDHARARTSGARADWDLARTSHEEVLRHFPREADAASIQLLLGEANHALGDHAAALRHYAVAERDGADSLAAWAAWQRVTVTDAWYESTRGSSDKGRDTLATAVIEAADALLRRSPAHPRAADLRWRQGQLALAHGWYDRASSDLGQLVKWHPADARAPLAASQRGDALFRLGRYEDAGHAFEQAVVVAREAGRDSLVRRASAAIPVCFMRHAEAAVVSDSTRHAAHAELFERVATQWPGYEQADVAQYRAALAWAQAGRDEQAVRCLQVIVTRYPASRFSRDARVQVATTLDSLHQRGRAAAAYVAFAKALPKDESAPAAWLRAADLLEADGAIAGSDSLRMAYVRLHPEDVESAMALYESQARRELAGLGPQSPISSLLPAGVRGRSVAPGSHLAAYLVQARAHPKLVSRDLLAQVRFLQGEEARVAYERTRLTQPLAKSLAGRQKLLDTLLVRYRRSAELGIAEWAHASAFRIGEALDHMGDAIAQCERPADLRGDDLRAYDDVLAEQAQAFHDRAEGVWSDLLRRRDRSAVADTWVTQAQSALWRRLATRFYFHPEVEFPLVDANSANRPETRARTVADGDGVDQ